MTKAALSIAILVLSFALHAEAAQEPTRFSVALGPAYLKNVTAPVKYGADGVGGVAQFAYRIDYDWQVRADLLVVHHIGTATLTQTIDVSLNVVYLIDIGQFVPYLVFGFSWTTIARRGDSPIYDGALQFGLGLEWRINRRWSVAVEGKNMVLFRDFTSYPSYLVIGLQGRIHW